MFSYIYDVNSQLMQDLKSTLEFLMVRTISNNLDFNHCTWSNWHLFFIGFPYIYYSVNSNHDYDMDKITSGLRKERWKEKKKDRERKRINKRCDEKGKENNNVAEKFYQKIINVIEKWCLDTSVYY